MELITLLEEKGYVIEGSALGNSKLPPELIEMIRKHFKADRDALPISPEEVRNH